MDAVIMLRATHDRQSIEIIDHPPDYGALRNTIGDAVTETQLEGDIIALTASSESEQIICTWHNLAFVGSAMLVAAKAVDGGYRSLTAKEINKYMYEFGGELL